MTLDYDPSDFTLCRCVREAGSISVGPVPRGALGPLIVRYGDVFEVLTEHLRLVISDEVILASSEVPPLTPPRRAPLGSRRAGGNVTQDMKRLEADLRSDVNLTHAQAYGGASKARAK